MLQMVLSKVILPFLLLFALTIVFSVKGYDDLAYKFVNKKPTGKDAFAHIGFVLAKLLASLYGGGLLTIFNALFFKKTLGLVFSEDKNIIFILIYTYIAYFIIGLLQNFVRHIQGRQQRSLFDTSIMKRNLAYWFPSQRKKS